MAEEDPIALNALRLAQCFSKMLKDIRGLEYRLDEANGRVRKAGLPGGAFPMRVGIRFSGFVSGEYAVFLGVETAARLAGQWTSEQGLPALEAARDEGESLVKEILNSAVGAAIRELERMAGGLEFDPATIHYRDGGLSVTQGQASAATGTGTGAVEPWGELLILGAAGPILCCFIMRNRGAGDAG